MSISYHIYNSESGFENMSTWDTDHFLPLGEPDEIMAKIDQLFSQRELDWEYYENHGGMTPYIGSYSCLANNNCCNDEEYIDLYLTVHEKGYICEVKARKGSPKLVRQLMEGLGLKCAFNFTSMKLVNPYEYEGNWVRTVDKH